MVIISLQLSGPDEVKKTVHSLTLSISSWADCAEVRFPQQHCAIVSARGETDDVKTDDPVVGLSHVVQFNVALTGLETRRYVTTRSTSLFLESIHFFFIFLCEIGGKRRFNRRNSLKRPIVSGTFLSSSLLLSNKK